MSVEQVIKVAVITNTAGIHARPAVKLTKLAKGFRSDLYVSVDDGAEWTNAKSTSSVMKLRARTGATLTVKAAGDDAESAVDAVLALVEAKFGED